MMQVRNIEIVFINNGTLKAFANILLCDNDVQIKLTSIGIHEKDETQWVSFPKISTSKGNKLFAYYPINQKSNKFFADIILEKYNELK